MKNEAFAGRYSFIIQSCRAFAPPPMLASASPEAEAVAAALQGVRFKVTEARKHWSVGFLAAFFHHLSA